MSNQTSRSYRFREYGGPEQLTLESTALRDPVHGEVRIKVQALSLSAGIADLSLPPVPVDREFHGLESLPDAMRYMASNEAAGKIVVVL